LPLAFASGLTGALSARTAPAARVNAAGVTELEKFIISETAGSASGGLMRTSRPSDSVFGAGKSIMEFPRSLTVVTPELMQKFGARDFSDLTRLTAGGERVNLYGVPGSPQLRDDFPGTFFNGMQRLFQRNQMPTSFGSVEGLDIVKGPAPANYGPTQAAGSVRSSATRAICGPRATTPISPNWASSPSAN
jgi:iron complex outermembrane receptor protein